MPADWIAVRVVLTRGRGIELERPPGRVLLREAITRHIEARRQDMEFRERLERMLGKNQEILERLAR